MNVMNAISILLLGLAWRWWKRLDIESDHIIYQGILLAMVTMGWFLRIVFVPH